VSNVAEGEHVEIRVEGGALLVFVSEPVAG
jgi:hypothetical protein